MSSSESDNEDVPQLSADTLAILEAFQREQAKKLTDVHSVIDDVGNKVAEIDIPEDWQLSQFWYDENTSKTLAQEALRCVGDDGKIALISCPTLYLPIIKYKPPNISVSLFEYDVRFSIYGNDFIPYDYNQPLEVPHGMEQSFDVVIADPPFLSEECLQKVSITIRHLSKDKIILCTGAVMQSQAKNLLGLDKSNFTPSHRNNLGNEFGCFTNYSMDEFLVKGNQVVKNE